MPAAARPLPAALEGLEPATLWSLFGQLSAIPRPSKHEGQVLAWLKAFAAERRLECLQDAVGNLVIRRPGSGGGEAAPTVVIQGHVDMVTEKHSHLAHDFMKDPLELVRSADGDWIGAAGTTLGADNGIGVCAALAVLDLLPGAKLPPVDALFTIDEETGLTGAFQLDPALIAADARFMLNLDTEQFPEVYVGCAGGESSAASLVGQSKQKTSLKPTNRPTNQPTNHSLITDHYPNYNSTGGDSKLALDLETEWPPEDSVVLEITVAGLLGGHSGIDIDADRGNAVKIAAAVVEAVLEAVPDARLALLQGGDKRNAIPREASADVAVPEAAADVAAAAVATAAAAFHLEHGTLETGLAIAAARKEQTPGQVLTAAATERLLGLIACLPHGVVKKSHAVAGLIETSSNLASVRPDAAASTLHHARVLVQCSTRSSLAPALERVRGVIRRLGAAHGAAVEQDTAYPGWAPAPDAPVVGLARAAIAEAAGVPLEDVAVKAIHAGLECGILGEKLPFVSCVSFGPTITGAHSPDERVQISTVAPFFAATLGLLARLADER
jgi:dipeptidase D